MGAPERPLQLLDPLLLLGIGPRGCASPPKRSLGSRFYFVLPTVIEIGSNLILAARLCHVAALQTFQHNLPLLFRGSLDSRLSRHSRLLAEAPSLTNFRVQFYWGALQNPLAGIAGVIEIIGRDLPSTSPALAVVKDVRLEIAQINRILTDLLETARPHPPQICKSNLNTTVEHAVMLARQQVFSKPIKIELQPAIELSDVEHDSDQIHQVLLNLLLNAVQAMDGEGTIRVDIGSRSDYATIEVSDSGKGISPQNLPNIFRPFFTTKGNGTGLGLSLARRIVEEHQGRIEVSSVVGKGSKFTVLLPFQMPVPETAS